METSQDADTNSTLQPQETHRSKSQNSDTIDLLVGTPAGDHKPSQEEAEKQTKPSPPSTQENSPKPTSQTNTEYEDSSSVTVPTPDQSQRKTSEKPSPNIIPIKGKSSPKPHVIKVTQKANEDGDGDAKSQTKNSDGNAKRNSNGSNNNNIKNTTDKNSTQSMASREDPGFKNETNLSDKGKNSPHSTDDNKGLIPKEKMLSEDGGGGNSAKTSHVAGDICRVFGVLFAVGVRAVLMAFCMFTVWLVVYRMENNYYWLLALSFIFFILETINIVITRGGQERKWFCLCFLCYLIAVIPCIWILEVDRLDAFQSAVSNSSLEVNVAGVSANIKLDPNTLLSVTEQCLIFLLILGRWLLPRGDITRDQLSQLLFVYIGMASDVMELFQLFDETQVRQDRTLTYIILSVWSLSLLQFTLVLTMSRSPKKVRTAIDHDEETARMKKKRLKDTSFILMLTQSELWSLCVSIFMQDGPFLAVRLFTLIKYKLINYTIIFFTCKNILVIMLLLYRVMILLLEKFENRNNDDDDDDDSKNKDDKYRPKTVSTHLSLSDVEGDAKPNRDSKGDGNFAHTQGQSQGVRARHPNQISPA